MKLKLSIIALGLTIVSCGSRKNVATPADTSTKEETVIESSSPTKVEETPAGIPNDKVSAYVSQYAEIAMEEMKQYGIPASITLAQGVLESGSGQGELVQKANNHFGIKCHDWKGAVVYHDDDEAGECFRKYSLAKFSYRDHSLFLSNRGRYSDLFKLAKDDYKAWAKGLKAAGYATDEKYPDKLIKIIQRYKLYVYDGKVLGKDAKDYKKITGNKGKHTVEKGDTLYRLSKKYKISVEKLKEINGLEGDAIFEGQVLYVEPFETGY